MNKYIIQGGHPLSGVVTVSGAKKTPPWRSFPAALLINGTCRIENVPDISDVRLLLEILDSMGAKIRRLSPNTLELCCTNVRDSEASDALVRRIRASLLFHRRAARPVSAMPAWDAARRLQLRCAAHRPAHQGLEAIGAAVDL